MKIILNAQGARELIKIDPENTVELAKNAASQVAQEIVVKINRTLISEIVEKAFTTEIRKSSLGNEGLRPKYVDMIENHVKNTAELYMNRLVAGQLDIEIHNQVTKILAKNQDKLDQQLRDRADAIILERFGEIFNKKD